MLWDPADNRIGVPRPPSGLHPKLVPNAQYKLDFADRAHRHMVAPDGALFPLQQPRWNKWRGIIVNALAGESARWGDYRRDVHQYRNGPYPLYTWNGSARDEHNRLLTTYFPVRHGNGAFAASRSRALPHAERAGDAQQCERPDRQPASKRRVHSAPATALPRPCRHDQCGHDLLHH